MSRFAAFFSLPDNALNFPVPTTYEGLVEHIAKLTSEHLLAAEKDHQQRMQKIEEKGGELKYVARLAWQDFETYMKEKDNGQTSDKTDNVDANSGEEEV